MMTVVKSSNVKFKGVGIVRTAEGFPVFDDYSNIPEKFFPMLSGGDLNYINRQIKKKENAANGYNTLGND